MINKLKDLSLEYKNDINGQVLKTWAGITVQTQLSSEKYGHLDLHCFSRLQYFYLKLSFRWLPERKRSLWEVFLPRQSSLI